MLTLKGISKTEMKLISRLEYEKRYFFTSADVDDIAKNKTQRYNIIKNLLKKGRIEKLNRTKYYLIPVKSTTGRWAEWTYIIVDEVMNGKDYFIGGWSAANYWKLTEQVPIKTEVYTTKRQGMKKFVSAAIIFRRTTRKRLKKAITKSVKGNTFKMLSKEETKKWLSKRDW